MEAQPPDTLHPAAWPPDRTGDADGDYEVVLAWGPFAVDLHAGARMGWRLTEVHWDGEHYLRWDDGDRVHTLADRDWHVWGDGLASPLGNGDELGTSLAVIRPIVPLDYADFRDLHGLPPEVVEARLRRLWGIPA